MHSISPVEAHALSLGSTPLPLAPYEVAQLRPRTIKARGFINWSALVRPAMMLVQAAAVGSAVAFVLRLLGVL